MFKSNSTYPLERQPVQQGPQTQPRNQDWVEKYGTGIQYDKTKVAKQKLNRHTERTIANNIGKTPTTS